MMVALPSLHLIARRFPDAERVLLTNFPIQAKAAPAAAVLGESGLIHGYMRYTVGTREIGELLRLGREIRRFGPDLMVYLMPRRPQGNMQRDQIFFRLAGVRRIVGVPEKSDAAPRLDAATGLYEEEARRLARMIGELGDADVDNLANWDLRLTEAERKTAAAALSVIGDEPLIVCAPGCKMQANDWGQERWRQLLGRLGRRYPQYALAMAGAKEDAEACDFAAMDWPGQKINLAGRLSPRESAAAFERAAIFLGSDSGPKHLAASVRTPCVCVFGARNLPGIWFPPGDRNQIVYHQPECFGCGLETCITMKKKCILEVTVEEMEQAVDRVLGAKLESSDQLT
jgi:ADP-heptose:LPS heptosyltransferase